MTNNITIIEGQLVAIKQRKTYAVHIHIQNGKISRIIPVDSAPERYILPPFVDAHVHIESAMLTPASFARLAVVHGTGATVSDPHEIGNVLGVEGVRYMIDNGREVPFYFCFGAPSCVPATPFETAGATIGPREVEKLLEDDAIGYLAEMMNWPGVLNQDQEVMEKIAIAKKLGKPVDGHAPGLHNVQARQYAAAGISTDHECFTAAEALDKLACGMKILIREGSAARNFDALSPLLHEHYQHMMFCSDDKHPDSLVDGHIDALVRRAVTQGIDVYKVLEAACLNPVAHYRIPMGQLSEGDPADFIVVNNLEEFSVLETWLKGKLVARDGRTLIDHLPSATPNNFSVKPLAENALVLKAEGDQVKVIQALDGQLITESFTESTKIVAGNAVSDVAKDILKLVVVNRYAEAPPAIAFIRGFGLSEGAIASSVAHDSHNLIAVGTDDVSITQALNLLIEHKGGVAAVSTNQQTILPLPIAGLMSDADGYEVARRYSELDRIAKQMGSSLGAPFMTLSFMALLVIPALKLSDKGLFDGENFAFMPVFTSA